MQPLGLLLKQYLGQLKLRLQNGMKLQTNMATEFGHVEMSTMANLQSSAIARTNLKLTIGLNLNPDYHRDSASFNRRCGIGAVRQPILTSSIIIDSRLNR